MLQFRGLDPPPLGQFGSGPVPDESDRSFELAHTVEHVTAG